MMSDVTLPRAEYEWILCEGEGLVEGFVAIYSYPDEEAWMAVDSRREQTVRLFSEEEISDRGIDRAEALLKEINTSSDVDIQEEISVDIFNGSKEEAEIWLGIDNKPEDIID